MEYLIPISCDRVIRDLVQEQLGYAAGDVHGEIHATLPFKETDLGAQIDPGTREECRVEN